MSLTARSALFLFLLVLVLRVAIAAQFRGNYDSRSYLIVADATLRGENVYTATNRYNYSPVWSFVVAGLWAMARPNVSLFILFAGLLQTVVDIGTAGLIGAIARRRLAFDEESARRAALIFFSNPVSVAVSSAHGQFDGLSIFFLLAAIWFTTDPAARKSRPAAVVCLALSLLIKHITAFHPLLFWRKWRRPGLALPAIAISYAVFAAAFLPYKVSFSAIGRNVILYPTMIAGSRGQDAGGLLSLLGFSGAQVFWFNGIAIAAIGWVIWKTRSIELPRACLILFLTLLTFLPSLAIQRYVWPIALGSLYVSPAFAVFSGAAALSHTGYGSQGLGLVWPVRIQVLGVWAAAFFWLVWELARIAREPREPLPSLAAPVSADPVAGG